jgi:succinylglutamic semialdehyde dehydrogenase
MLTVKVLGDFLGGQWVRPRGVEHKIVSRDPGDQGYRIGAFPVAPEHAETAVSAAVDAGAAWGRLPAAIRADYLRKFAAELVNRRGELARLVAAETGKPLWEAELEVTEAGGRVEMELREGQAHVQPIHISEVRWGVSGEGRYRPLGATLVLGSAAAPLEQPLGWILPALLSGNTVVFKPSKLVPAVGQAIAEIAEHIELPAGVLNLVQGEAEVGLKLVADTRLAAVLFCGSHLSGARVVQAALGRLNRMVALAVGGINTAVVLSDADLDQAVYECARGAFLTTGQRPSSTGVVLVERGALVEFTDAFGAAVRALKVGYAFEPDVFMGPLLSEAARARALDRQEQLERFGAQPLLRGEPLKLKRPGHYLSPAVWRLTRPEPIDSFRPDGQSFGPDVVLVPFDDDEQGQRLAASTAYPLGVAVFTRDAARFEAWAEALPYGLVNHNLATTDQTPRLPFLGLGGAGSHRPSGVLAQHSCSYPQALLRATEAYDTSRNLPNFPGK